MNVKYDPSEIEPRWQQFWQENNIYKTGEPSNDQPKKYVLDMFPYPSGAGLHVGHIEGYTGTDVLSRYYRMKGFAVLHPIGWDAFGLPAENYAIKNGIPPEKSTHDNIKTFKNQINKSGLSYDWDREIDSSSPEYYKWTQWLFILLFKHGLAYKKKAPANWCPKDETVLANEQVVDGKCERCGSEVIQKDLDQWFFKITDYADRLIDGLDTIDWPKSTKSMQKNWIGKKTGAVIKFKIKNPEVKKQVIEVFTTRPDTICGVSFLALAPEHELTKELALENSQVRDYLQTVKEKTDIQRENLNKEKTGIDTGILALNPVNGKEVPIYIADYVLSSTGTGAVMGVPAHDLRDFEFAQKFKLPVVSVIASDNSTLPFEGHGLLENSGKYNKVDSKEVLEQFIRDYSEDIKISSTLHLRDWLVSRQRYWGAPIPMIFCNKCGWSPVPEAELPVLLPTDVDFTPTGESPIAKSKTFQNEVQCPQCGLSAKREVDTMDTFVDSSWYFLRFCDPQNIKEPWNKDKTSLWSPIDIYVGGAEHTVLHLMYSRFFYKFFFDLGMVDKNSGDEPFLKLRHQGTVLGPDSRKMSKRWGNVINPDDVIKQYGADTLRMYEMFMGPFEGMKPWSVESVAGVNRFLARINTWHNDYRSKMLKGDLIDKDLEIAVNKLVKKVTEDIENFSFNTSIAAMMGFLNQTTDKGNSQTGEISWKQMWENFLLVLAPFAPHLTEDLWQDLNPKSLSIHKQSWPLFDNNILQRSSNSIVVTINSKVRGNLEIANDLKEEGVEQVVKESTIGQKYLIEKKIKKLIYIRGRIINIVTE